MPAGTTDEGGSHTNIPSAGCAPRAPGQDEPGVNAFGAAADQVSGRLPGSGLEVNQTRRNAVRTLQVTPGKGLQLDVGVGCTGTPTLIESGMGAGTTTDSCASTVAATEPGQKTSGMGRGALEPH